MIQNWLSKLNTVKSLQLFHLFRFGSALLIGIVLVRLGMSKEEVSSYEYFLFVSAFLSFFWVNGVLKTMMSYYNKYDHKGQMSLLSNTSILLLLIGASISLVAYIINLTYPFIRPDLLMWVIFYIIISTIGALDTLILVLKDKPKMIFNYGLVIFSIQLIVMVYAIYFLNDIESIIKVFVSWAMLRFIYSLFLLKKYAGRAINWSQVWMLLLVALPLIGESLMGNAMEYIDGVLVKSYFDESLFGVYRYGARELPFSSLFVVAIGTAIIPIMSTSVEKGLNEMKAELSKLMRWLYPLSILLMLISPFLFTWVYSDDYILSAKIFNIYLLVVMSRMVMPHIILISKQKNSFLFLVSIIELVLNFLLSILLLKWIGVMGIPLASLIAYIVNKSILTYYVDKKLGIKLMQYLNVKAYIIYSSLLIISYFISTLYI